MVKSREYRALITRGGFKIGVLELEEDYDMLLKLWASGSYHYINLTSSYLIANSILVVVIAIILKIEDESIDGTPLLPRKRRLKLAIFIVINVGQKIGELFIKLSIDPAPQNNIFEIYLTHFTEPDDRLVQLISKHGFQKVSVNERGEDIYLKEMIVDSSYVRANSLL
ncbi:hypothetical protein IPdc08_00068 [archaeon]|nr:hypothetical protein IPdc08_00068 [archaeon]